MGAVMSDPVLVGTGDAPSLASSPHHPSQMSLCPIKVPQQICAVSPPGRIVRGHLPLSSHASSSISVIYHFSPQSCMSSRQPHLSEAISRSADRSSCRNYEENCSAGMSISLRGQGPGRVVVGSFWQSTTTLIPLLLRSLLLAISVTVKR